MLLPPRLDQATCLTLPAGCRTVGVDDGGADNAEATWKCAAATNKTTAGTKNIRRILFYSRLGERKISCNRLQDGVINTADLAAVILREFKAAEQ